MKRPSFQIHLPNFLTLLRILIIPAILVTLRLETPLAHFFAALMFVAASLTDFLDGFLARKWSTQSRIGSFLDSTADKLLVGAVIVMLVHLDQIPGIHVYAAVIIIMREILVAGLRQYLAEINVSIPASKLGKTKTLFQMAAITLLILDVKSDLLPFDLHSIAILLLWLSALLTVVSGYIYLRTGLSHMTGSEE